MYVYSMLWHINRSSAFLRLLEPIRNEIKEWRQNDLGQPQEYNLDSDVPAVFCQVPPPKNFMHHKNLTWIPMGDYNVAPDYLKGSHVKVISFSNPTKNVADKLGLRVYETRYAPEPSPYYITPFNTEMFYWNRINAYRQSDLVAIANILGITRITVMEKHDAGKPSNLAHASHPLIHRVKSTWDDNDEYQTLVKKSFFFLAPRINEGVGMAFLEAMARGQVVLATDTPSMNHYIQDGVNGILNIQNNKRLTQSQFESMGENAKATIARINSDWQSSFDQFASFIGE